jgi:uncharacterized protein (DUF1800 family)
MQIPIKIEHGVDMKILDSILIHPQNGIASRVTALVSMLALLAGTFTLGVRAQQMSAGQNKSLTEDQRILHVLNRLGYGARPGDVERVKALGIDNYIKQQLDPQHIDDTVAEAKVKNLATLNMTTAELYEKYPQPGQLVRQLQRRGELPADLDLQKLQAQGALGPPIPAEKKDAKSGDDAMAADQNGKTSDAKGKKDPDYREKIREYYEKNGLQPPARITGELQASRILRAVYSERQLQEVMVDFWTNHFNVFAGKGADRWLLTSYDRDTIRPNAMGKFEDLLVATAKSPAMLFYLDNFQSVSPNANPGSPNGNQRRAQAGRDPLLEILRGRAINRRGIFYPQQQPNSQQRPAQQQQQARRGINENYARELMELHTLGVDGGYTQKDVQEVARCFTGWTIFAPRGGAAAAQAIMNGPRAEMLRDNAGSFFFNPRAHDDGEKIVLGHKIPKGGGMGDGLMVLDILAHQPATAKFIATKLVRHFVSDNPPPALVDRVAQTFLKSDGDIRQTLSTIFFSPEFNSTEAYRAKIKRPFELAISAMRTLGADTNGGPGVHQWIAKMGEPLYGFQTPNGYSDTAENWVNTGALLERLNFGLALASNRVPGTRVDLRKFVNAGDVQSIDKAKIMDRFLNLIVVGDISPKTRETLLKQIDQKMSSPPPPRVTDQEVAEMNGPPPGRGQFARASQQAEITDPVTKIVGLILGSPEFQRQ